MRILHTITTIERGGAENQLLLLVREQIKKGHEVTVLPLKGDLELKDSFLGYGAKIEASICNLGIISQIMKLNKISRNFDIVHAHLPRAEILSACINSKRLIVSRHNCESFVPYLPGIVSRVLSRFVEKRSKKIIAISETVRNFLVTNQEARREHIVVVRYGFDSEIDYGKGGSQFSDGEIFHIGTVSRLVPQKDLGTLLKAFSILERNFPSSKLSIVGAGPDELKLKEEAENLGISSKTHWLGRITNPLEFMSKLDAYVMTSIYEGFGLVVLEAISQRVPVILSDIPTFRELFSENSEEFFPVGDHQKLASILINMADKQSRARALDSQIKTLSNFSPNKMIEDMENVYVGVLK